MIDVDNPSLIVDPDDVQRDERVLHPERVIAVSGKKENHAAILRHLVAIHEPLLARRVVPKPAAISIGADLYYTARCKTDVIELL